MGSLLSTENVNPAASYSSDVIPGALKAAVAALGESSYKMIFVVNMDLKMGRGKQCAQVAHAALGLYLKIQESGIIKEQAQLSQWIRFGQKKVVVKGNNLAHMETVQDLADKANLPNILITDAGCTQIPRGSKTVLAIFGTSEALNPVTGSLKLL